MAQVGTAASQWLENWLKVIIGSDALVAQGLAQTRKFANPASRCCRIFTHTICLPVSKVKQQFLYNNYRLRGGQCHTLCNAANTQAKNYLAKTFNFKMRPQPQPFANFVVQSATGWQCRCLPIHSSANAAESPTIEVRRLRSKGALPAHSNVSGNLTRICHVG